MGHVFSRHAVPMGTNISMRHVCRHLAPTARIFHSPRFSTDTSSLRDEHFNAPRFLPTHRPHRTNTWTYTSSRWGRIFQCATFADTSPLRHEYFTRHVFLPTHRPYGTNISMRHVFYPHIVRTGRTPGHTHRPDGDAFFNAPRLPTPRPYGTNISLATFFYRHIVPTGRTFQCATFSTHTSSAQDEHLDIHIVPMGTHFSMRHVCRPLAPTARIFHSPRFSTDTSSLRDEHFNAP